MSAATARVVHETRIVCRTSAFGSMKPGLAARMHARVVQGNPAKPTLQ